MMLSSSLIECARWVALICAVGIIIDSLEILYSRHEYGPQGILNWSILKLDSRFMLTSLGGRALGVALGAPAFMILIAAQLAFASAILANVTGRLWGVCVIGILLIKLLSHLRSVHGGLDGSDQMQIVVFGSLSVFYVMPGIAAKTIALWFIAAQAMLSYLAAGLAKLASPVWRGGEAMAGIMSTDHFGNERIGHWLRDRHDIATVACWLVIAFECIAPLLVFAGPIPALVFLCCALTFHLTVAAIMGLNTFVWSFGSTFPAVWFLAQFFK